MTDYRDAVERALAKEKGQNIFAKNGQWSLSKPTEYHPTVSVNCNFTEGIYPGGINIETPNLEQAQRLFNHNRSKLAEAFSMLSLNPMRPPNIEETDWKFEYDDHNEHPEYKYNAVRGTLNGLFGEEIKFSMTKQY
ncbi:MAG TPA: hypothetical protein VG895_05180 [Patescibacteria group bacterium]|nr:hypothetical protein [Patescibacteria group bacterium]